MLGSPRTPVEKCCLKITFCPGDFLKLARDTPSAWHAQGAGPAGTMDITGVSFPIILVITAIFWLLYV